MTFDGYEELKTDLTKEARLIGADAVIKIQQGLQTGPGVIIPAGSVGVYGASEYRTLSGTAIKFKK